MRMNSIGAAMIALVLAACSGGDSPPPAETAPTQDTPVVEAPITTEPTLLGDWVSSEDPLSTFAITQTTLSFGYDGISDADEPYTIQQGCPSAPDAPFQGDTIVTQTAEGDEFCYAIDSVESDRLVLIYLPRGNALEFQRPQ